MLVLLGFSSASHSAGTIKLKHAFSIYTDGGLETELPLQDPEGVTSREGMFLIVADTGHGRLLRYAYREEGIDPEALVISMPELSYPQKTLLNSQDVLYVLDGRQRRILRLTAEGEFLGRIDPSGLPSAAPSAVRSFAIDGEDNLYLLDIRSELVLVLGPYGAYQRQISFPPDYGFLTDVTVDFKGTVYVVDSVAGAIFQSPRGASSFSLLTDQLKDHGRFFSFLTVDKRGRILLVDRNGSGIVVLGPDGSFATRQSSKGWKDGLLNYPAQIFFSNGAVIIADTKNHRVQVFSVSE